MQSIFWKDKLNQDKLTFSLKTLKIQCKTIFWKDKLKSDKLNWDTNVENMGIIAILPSTQFLSRQIIRRQNKSGQIESGQIESGWIKSGQIVSGHGQNLTWSNLA